jgi:hypothetical protein
MYFRAIVRNADHQGPSDYYLLWRQSSFYCRLGNDLNTGSVCLCHEEVCWAILGEFLFYIVGELGPTDPLTD